MKQRILYPASFLRKSEKIDLWPSKRVNLVFIYFMQQSSITRNTSNISCNGFRSEGISENSVILLIVKYIRWKEHQLIGTYPILTKKKRRRKLSDHNA
jgi:hypothetical protein